jgi:hypothetical protein
MKQIERARNPGAIAPADVNVRTFRSQCFMKGIMVATIYKRVYPNSTSPIAYARGSQGRPKTESFTRITEAKKWVAATETAIREGRYFPTLEAKRHTVGELIGRYECDILEVAGPLRWTRRHPLPAQSLRYLATAVLGSK